jgi:hypothetical protein
LISQQEHLRLLDEIAKKRQALVDTTTQLTASATSLAQVKLDLVDASLRRAHEEGGARDHLSKFDEHFQQTRNDLNAKCLRMQKDADASLEKTEVNLPQA